MNVNSKMTAIADRFRAKTGGTGKLNLDQMVEAVDEVYDAGYEKGKAEGGGNDFWDKYQEYGERRNYRNAFSGTGWTDELFKPKYDIIVYNSPNNYNIFTHSSITNLKKLLEDAGVVLDISRCSYIASLFEESMITTVGELNFTGANNIVAFTRAMRLQSVDKVILSNTVTQNFTSNSFMGCSALTHIIFEGTIRGSGMNMKDSPLLDKESITSVINCLATDTSGLTVTLSKTAVNKAFETSAGAADGSTSEEWLALVATKSNWTISLS